MKANPNWVYCPVITDQAIKDHPELVANPEGALWRERHVQWLEELSPATKNPPTVDTFEDEEGQGVFRRVGRLLWGPRGKLAVPFIDAADKDRAALAVGAYFVFKDLRRTRMYKRRIKEKLRYGRFEGLEHYVFVCRPLDDGEAALWRAEQAGDFAQWSGELSLGSSLQHGRE